MLEFISFILFWSKLIINESEIGIGSSLGGLFLLRSCGLWVSRLCIPHCNLQLLGLLLESSECSLKGQEFCLLSSNLASNSVV
jgi:hypothetical protein